MHGIDIVSAWPLPGARRVDRTDEVWSIVEGTGERPDAGATGDCVMQDESFGRVQAEAYSVGREFLFRAPTVCTALIDPIQRYVRVWPEDADREMFIPLVLQGALAAFLVDLCGAVAMHASAVEVDGRAVLFAGVSGQGKSTTAVMAVDGGARFFSDDVARVEVSADVVPVAYRGTVEARLRPAAEATGASRAVGVATRLTSDGRTAVTLDDGGADVLPIGAIVLPRPDRAAMHCTVTRLGPEEAFVELHRCLRLPGWIDPAIRLRRFDRLGEITERVAVLRAYIPWQLPFAREAGAALVHAIDAACGRRARSLL